MIARRLTLAILVSLCALVGLFALSGVSAQAAVTHDYLSRITEIPTEGPKGEAVPIAGPLSVPAAMTVDSGNLWVSEFIEGTGNFRVDEFNASSGAFVSQLARPGPSLNYFDNGIAVGHATGETELYVGTDAYSGGGPEGAVAVYSATGELQNVWTGADTPEKAFGCFECSGHGSVAVDSSTSLGDWASGDVFVSSPMQGVVDVFAPEANGGEKYVPVSQLTGPEPGVPFSNLRAVAVSGFNGDVVVAAGQVAYVFEPTALDEYTLVRELTGTPGGAFGGLLGHVAVDGGNGDIYVSEEQRAVVYQFSAGGAYLGRMTGVSSPPGDFHRVTSMAVDAETHDVYVGDDRNNSEILLNENSVVDVFGGNIVLPDVTTGAVSGQKATGEGRIEATLNGTVNPDKAGAATCQFDWGTTSALGEVAACSAPVADGESAEPVHAVLSGLAPDTKYFYRLQATDTNGTNPGEPWQIQEFRTVGPGIPVESVSAVRSESVTFDARIDPNNAPTTYYFQYGTTAAYGSNVPAAPAAVGSGEGGVEVAQHVQGISAATAYHYRVVAVSEMGPGETEVFDGPDQTFKSQTVGLPLQLPDGRGYEMVSPPQKEGAAFGWIDRGGVLKASANGDAFTDWSWFQAPEENPVGEDNIFASIFFGRSASGWSTKTLQPPHKVASGTPYNYINDFTFFSEDLSKGVFRPYGPFEPAFSSEATEQTPYIRTDYLNSNPAEPCVSGCFHPLVTASNVPSGTEFGEEPCTYECGPQFDDATPDGNHVVLSSRIALTTTATEGNGGLYEWSAGTLQMVNLLPEGEVNAIGGRVGETASLGTGGVLARHAISNDGARVVWQTGTKNTPTEPGLNHLYLRDTVRGETVRLDLFQGVAEHFQGHAPVYMTASSDASRIFFMDEERLTTDATAIPGALDLYEYDVNAPLGTRLTDLSVDKNPREAAHVAAVVGASEDGSYVYFAAAGVLAQGANPGYCGNRGSVQAGEELSKPCNLYMRHNGVTKLVAGLSQEDFPDWEQRDAGLAIGRVSPNGGWLAFMSDGNLTGYDTTDAVSHHPDEEVYLYNASNGKLVCGSCNPTGARPVGAPQHEEGGATESMVLGNDSMFGNGAWIASNIPAGSESNNGVSGSAAYQSRYLLDSGRMFFDSHDALVPQDDNGTQDVYEYEPAGVGDCNPSLSTFSEKADGCVSMISSGTSSEESAFLDASETGSNVFFLTLAKLVPQDFDNAIDIYDARECGAQSPCIALPPVQPPPCDTGDSCKPAPTPQPEAFGAPSSATFSGSGNLSPAGSVKRTRSGKAPVVTRAQKRARALKACHRKKSKRKRTACEKQARARYGVTQSRKVNATKRGRG